MSYDVTLEDGPRFCQRHPKTETSLQCYQCGAPICPRCAMRTPVGYQCPDCRRGLKQRFEQARPLDYGIASVVSLVLGGIAGIVLPFFGWITIFLSPLSGTIIAEIVWRLVNRRFSSHLWKIVVAGIIIGTLPHFAFVGLGAPMGSAGQQFFSWIQLLWPLLHIGMAVGAASARLRLGS